jgi:nitrile hydratase accessory protein
MERMAKDDVAQMQGNVALPRKSGELVFHDAWERRAFAMAVALAESGRFEWSDFQQQLIRSIADAERNDPQNPSRDYFESWLLSLESLLVERGVLTGDF